MRRNLAPIVVVAVLLASIGVAWLVQSLVAGTDSAGAYTVRVIRDDRERAAFDLAALERIGTKTVVLQGKPQRGPTLLDVLKEAGVDDFSQVEIIGAGKDDSGRLVLRTADVGPDVVLAISNRGTVKIAGPDISMEMRVRDVTELVVQ